jgi:CheY-like chemotaxis protein
MNRILMAEDNLVDRELLSEILEAGKREILEANAIAASEAFGSWLSHR